MASAGRLWWRSASVRFALAYTVLFGVSAFVMVYFLWWSTSGVLDRQTNTDIAADAQNLQTIYGEGLANAYNTGLVGGVALTQALNALAEAITTRVDNSVDDDAIYLLTDSNMRAIAGSFDGWPPQIDRNAVWSEVRLSVGGTRVPFRIRHYHLPLDVHLLIGRDMRSRGQLEALVGRALPWTAVIILGLGIFGAAVVRRFFGAMLADVSRTAAAISAGDLARRVRVTGRGDEFDGLAETINEMLDRISRLMDGVREVSNAIAHDLRTPIARARARLEDAARPGTTEAELRAAIERGVADLDGLTAVFHALLRIAEIEAGARRSAFAAVDVVALLRDLAELYEAAAEESGHHLTVTSPDRLMIFGDRDMLQQAVANLLDNALKFSPAGGEVGIAANRLSPTTVEIAVTDQGPGIPAADRDRATDRFFRGESARHAPGSGLGLALVQAVATLHGGMLRLEDNDPGLRATIALPAGTPGMEQVSLPPQRAAIPHTA